jgi:hypothetical protein
MLFSGEMESIQVFWFAIKDFTDFLFRPEAFEIVTWILDPTQLSYNTNEREQYDVAGTRH